MIWRCFVLCALIASSSSFVQADTAKGIAAYHRGEYSVAFKELFRPAELGDPVAQFSIALLYYRGQGVPMNHTEARRWYKLAADQGYGRAQVNLAIMCAEGEGGPRDFAEAYKWFTLAAAQGIKNGAEARDALIPRMTPAQLEAAKKRATDWERVKY
jgi:TPR repeat protein